jgi:membrane associated rhomboid family serine protease
VIPLRDANPTRRRPVVTISLILACVAVFGYELLIQSSDGDAGLERFVLDHGLIPADLVAALRGSGGAGAPGLADQLLSVVTSMFLHGGWIHLIGNMLYLWIFGNNIEDRLGRLGFLLFYLLGGVAAAASQVLVGPDSDVPVIGASGAIAAVLGAYLVLYPRARVLSLVFLGFFYQLLHVPAVLILGFWFVLQLIDGVASLGVTNANGGVALFEHIGGFIAGVVVGLLIRTVGSPGASRVARSIDGMGVG